MREYHQQSEMAAIILDLQGFKQPKDSFVLKEVAYIKDGISTPTTLLFAPPCSWENLPKQYRRVNRWLEHHYHGLSWNAGCLPYKNVRNILMAHVGEATTIYVKGKAKVLWLRELLAPTSLSIENLEDFGCPALHELRKAYDCLHHPHGSQFVCATRNVMILADWRADTSIVKPTLERSLRLYAEAKHLALLKPEDIACLPKTFLLLYCASEVDCAWFRLPQEFREDPEIAACRRCYKHHSAYNPPMIRNCEQCTIGVDTTD